MTLRRRRGASGSPVELRFIDLFMLIIAALVLVAMVAILISAQQRRPAPLTVLTRSLPVALQDEPYEIYLAGRGGQPPYGWSVVSGALPDGMSLDGNSGRISGIPTSHGETELEVALRDGWNDAARAALRFTARATTRGEPLQIIGPAAALPEAVTSIDYRHRITAFGGRAPYRFNASPLELPPGLELTADGLLRGRVVLVMNDQRLAAPWRFTVTAVDTEGTETNQLFGLPVRYQPRQTRARRFLQALGVVLGLAATHAVAPILLLSLSLVVAIAVIGFGGGKTIRWYGLQRRKAP